jgi:hypothetical protein
LHQACWLPRAWQCRDLHDLLKRFRVDLLLCFARPGLKL